MIDEQRRSTETLLGPEVAHDDRSRRVQRVPRLRVRPRADDSIPHQALIPADPGAKEHRLPPGLELQDLAEVGGERLLHVAHDVVHERLQVGLAKRVDSGVRQGRLLALSHLEARRRRAELGDVVESAHDPFHTSGQCPIGQDSSMDPPPVFGEQLTIPRR